MNAQSLTSFGNEDALDFIDEVKEDGQSAVLNAFEVVEFLKPDDYLCAPDARVAIAAAEFVAAVSGKPPAGFPPAAAALASKLSADGALRGRASAVVNRVLDYSELKELWLESPKFEGWKAAIAGLLERLK